MEEPQKNTDFIYAMVDTFVSQYHVKDVALKPEATKLIIERTMGKDFWGRVVKKSYSLANIIGEQISHYVEIQSAMDSTVKFYSQPENKPDSILSNSFITAMNKITDLKKRRDDTVIALFENIQRAKINNLIDEIGLGKKLKRLEEECTVKDRLIESLEKLNKELKEENDELHKRLPNFLKKKTEVGGLSKS
jgi:hypothetical protein